MFEVPLPHMPLLKKVSTGAGLITTRSQRLREWGELMVRRGQSAGSKRTRPPPHKFGPVIAISRDAMSRPPPFRGFSYRGVHRYLLTFCTIERARIFERPEAVDDALQQIRITASRERFAILAYCFMPDPCISSSRV